MKLYLLFALAATYKVKSPLLMQVVEGTDGSVTSYVDDEMVPETQEEAEADAAAQAYSNNSTSVSPEASVTETPHHNKQAEQAEIPQGESNATEAAGPAPERTVGVDEGSSGYPGYITDQILALSVADDSLTQSNNQLNEDNAQLQELIANAYTKLNQTTTDTNSQTANLTKQLTSEEVYGFKLHTEHEAKVLALTNTSSSSSSDSQQPDFEASSAMTFVMGIAVAFVFFQGAQYFLGSNLDICLEKTVQGLYGDVTMLTLLWAGCFIFYYCDLFDNDKVDQREILTGLGIFILAWFFLGIWLLFAAQSQARRWSKIEEECSDMRKLKNAYEEAFNDQNEGKANGSFIAKREAMQYAVMRQEFIRPTFQVPVAEVLLRSDFELSEYLCRCLAKVLDETLKMSWLSYFLMVGAVVFWRLMLKTSSNTQLAMLALIPLFAFLVLLTLKSHLSNVYYELVPYILDPYEVHINDNFSKEPLHNVDKIPRPPYLRGKLPSLEESTEAMGQHPLKLTCAYIFSGRFPNRHQILFFFDSYGPRTILFTLQGVCIVSVLWVTVLALYYSRFLYEIIGLYCILVLAASFAVALLIAGTYISQCIRLLCLTTKLEQMKDRKVIQEVVCKVKADRAIRVMKIYRKMKLIYREQHPEAEVLLPAKQQALISEVYELLAKDGSLHISALDEVMMMLGFELQEEELRIFAKECEPDEDFNISFDHFRRAVSRMLASSRLKPEAVTRRVLRTYFQQVQRRDKVTHLSLTELEQFFSDYSHHLTTDELNNFLFDARFLLDDGAELKVNEFAYMLKHEIELFPH